MQRRDEVEFKKYQSIENHDQEKFIEGFLNYYPELKGMKYIATEKIHGTNFSVYLIKIKIEDMRVVQHT